MIIPAATNNALQAGTAEVVASSVIISEIVTIDNDVETVLIDTGIETILIEAPDA